MPKFDTINKYLLGLELSLELTKAVAMNVINDDRPAKIPMSVSVKWKYCLTNKGIVVMNALLDDLTVKVNTINIIKE